MSVSIATMVKDGHKYIKTWPLQRQLYALFPECRVISATKFAKSYARIGNFMCACTCE